MPDPRQGESKRKFIARFMSSAEARNDFPDPSQRRAVAESAWKRLVARKRADLDYYGLAKQALSTCCAKQDVPEVQAVIGLLQGPLESFWRARMQEALDTAVERLRELEDELPTSQVDGLAGSDSARRDEELLILAFLSILDRAARQPLPPRIEALLGRAAEELLRDGARSQGLEIDLARAPLARAAAREDLKTLISGRIETRRGELQEQAREFLRSRRARTPARPGDITEAAAGFRAKNLQEWLSQNVALVGLRTSEWLPAVADQWAYRWFVVGQFVAGRQAGLTELVARAVLDDRTTEFCIWVHGRTLSVSGAQSQLDRHIRASLQGDIQTLMANWPMLDSRTVQSTDRKVLRRAFSKVGLPPYHFRCRTLIQWVRVGQTV